MDEQPRDRDDAPAAEPGSAAGRPRSVEAEETRQRDRRLVDRARGGELDAFNLLVLHYQDYLVALTTRITGDMASAEDAVQEAFFSAYRNLAGFRGDSFRAWLTRIAVNAATDVTRRRQRRPAEPYPELDGDSWEPRADDAADPEGEAIRRAQGRALAAALSQLNEGQRIAILLFDVEGYDYPAIADITGVSLGTVKSRIHRGRLALREALAASLELFRT